MVVYESFMAVVILTAGLWFGVWIQTDRFITLFTVWSIIEF